MKVGWRKNVLTLVGSGYAAVLAVFIILVAAAAPLDLAIDAVKGLLATLVGGSLAISKDLIPLSDGGDRSSAPKE